jgi:hypothetical protein
MLFRSLLSFGMVCFAVTTLPAQPKDAPKPLIKAPTLTTAANLGAKPGTTIEITLTGTNLGSITQVWTSFAAEVKILPEPKSDTKCKISLSIPKNAPLGLHTFRVASEAGLSNARVLTLDELPEVLETDKNRTKASPQVITNPCVVTGKVETEGSDFFRFPVQAGVPVTLEVLARRLGSSLDPVILMHDASGKELAGLYADDTPGLQTDARLTFTPKATGEYIAEIRDSTYRGGDGFTYRFRVGQCASATTAFPVAIEAGKKSEVRFAGPDVKGIDAVTLEQQGRALAMNAFPRRGQGLAGVPVPVLITPEAQVTEAEPNNDITKANTLPVPGGITAKLDTKADVDCFKIVVKKDKKYTVTAITTSINSPAEVLVKVQDAKDTKLGESNPTQPLSQVKFTATVDGEIFIVCEHQNYLAGPNELYWLRVSEDVPDFSVTLGADKLEVPTAGVGLLPITAISKLNGFNSPITLSLGLGKEILAETTLPANLNPTAALPYQWAVSLKAIDKLKLANAQVVAKADKIEHLATTGDIVKQAFAGLPNPPLELTSHIAVMSTPELPYTLSVVFEKPEVMVGNTLKGTIKATRLKDFNDEIPLSNLPLPANVTAKLKPIPKDKSEIDFEIVVAANAPVGPMQWIVKGTSKWKDREVTSIAMPVMVTLREAKKKEEPKKEKK